VPQELPHTLTNSEDLVLFNNTLTTIGAVYHAQRSKDPKCAINSFKVIGLDEATGKFTLEKETHIVFQPAGNQTVQQQSEEGQEGQEGEATSVTTAQGSAGSLAPANSWEGPHTKLLWSVRWKAKGLMPIRPQICMLEAGILAPGRGLSLQP
jgi:hypothetical protein